MEVKRKGSFLHCEKMSPKPILLNTLFFLYTKHLLCWPRSVFSILGWGKHWSLEPFCSADPVQSSQIWKAALSEQNESCCFQAVTETSRRSFSRNSACSQICNNIASIGNTVALKWPNQKFPPSGKSISFEVIFARTEVSYTRQRSQLFLQRVETLPIWITFEVKH